MGFFSAFSIGDNVAKYSVEVCDFCKTEIKSNSLREKIELFWYKRDHNKPVLKKGKTNVSGRGRTVDNKVSKIAINFESAGIEDILEFEICIKCAAKLYQSIFLNIDKLKNSEVE